MKIVWFPKALAQSALDRILAASIVLLTFAIHSVSPVTQSYDSRWVVHTALSLLHHGDADLNEYMPQLAEHDFYHIECIGPAGDRKGYIKDEKECAGGKLYHYYPLGVAVTVLPIVGAMDMGARALAPMLANGIAERTPYPYRPILASGDVVANFRFTEEIIASLLIAISAAAMYLLAREWVNPLTAWGLAFLYAFGTSAWSTGSRSLWQHGFSMLFLALTFLLLRSSSRWRWTLSGFLLTLAFFVRPTNVVPLAVVGLWILWKHRQAVLAFAAGATPVVLFFGALHFSIYGALLPSYSQVDRGEEAGLSFGPHVPVALVGNLVSPSRGVFVYLPVMVFSIAGLVLWARSSEAKNRELAWMLAAIFVGHYFLICLYEDWFGGHGYGPRYFADLSPLLLLPLCALLAKPWRWAWGLPLLICGAIGIFMHSQGALCGPCLEWAVKPAEIRESQWRLWDWKDPMFLRGLRPTPRQ